MVEVTPNSIESVMSSIYKFGSDARAALKYATVAVRLITDKLEDPMQEQDKSQQYLVNSNGFSTMPSYKADDASDGQNGEGSVIIPADNVGHLA
jgi:hypothetical protein